MIDKGELLLLSITCVFPHRHKVLNIEPKDPFLCITSHDDTPTTELHSMLLFLAGADVRSVR
jgi:hypothetical protein